jgi:hypothetical protein
MTMERTLTGAFRATALAADAWRLTSEGSAEVYLTGVESDSWTGRADAGRADATASAVAIVWLAAGADERATQPRCTVTLISAGRSVRKFTARTAIIHEPRPRLYDGLPLVVLDDTARRFWSRVFFIARVPGGRRLLRWIAQRSAGT